MPKIDVRPANRSEGDLCPSPQWTSEIDYGPPLRRCYGQNWFDQSASAPHDEVNFWQPSGTTQFRALQPAELFLFKLHAPNNFIVGGGIFGHASIAPLSLAWGRLEERRFQPR
ncbi:hypothetical protein [Bradyrhizobium sp. B120]|uniref:hypothetical protein n=1 Tax=Bradyrhizobium sp. B120 TaxID=3410088 RepID=UPI003B97EF27